MANFHEMKREDLIERVEALGATGVRGSNKDELIEILEAQERAAGGELPPISDEDREAASAALAGAQPDVPAGAQAASPPPTSSETYRDDQYTREQLIAEAESLLGAPSYFASVALRRFGGDESYLTLPEAQAAVDSLSSHTVEG
jgi:hypothetical protein